MKLLAGMISLLALSSVQAQTPDVSSSDVADAAERATGRRMHMSEHIRQLSGTRLFGPAITMHVVRDDTASSTVEGLKAIQVVESAPAGSVIVVSLEGDPGFAVFGATFATLAKSRRLGGFVVDASMRGVSDFRQLGVAMFARGTVAGSAGGHYRLNAVNVPVRCGGVEVAPGDLVVGDADGIAIAPKERYQEVLAKAAELRDEKNALLPLITKHRSYTAAVEQRKAAQQKNKSRQ